MIAKPSLPILDRSHPLAKGLVACYPFFERGGARLRDISGSNNHGTLTNMDPATAWGKTPRGYGLNFDGINNYVNVPTLIVGAKPLTMSMWVKYTNYGGMFFGQSNANSGVGFGIYLDWGFYGGIVSGGQWPNGIGPVTPPILGEWTLVTITIDAINGTKLYYNNVLKHSNTSIPANQINTTPVTIGYITPWSLYYTGGIGEFYYWNRTLLIKEIATLYADPWSIYRTSPLNTVGSIPPITTYLRNLALMGVGQ